MNRHVRGTVVLATATALLTGGALSAQAAPMPPPSGDVVGGLVGPLGLAVGSQGTVYVAVLAGQGGCSLTCNSVAYDGVSSIL